MTRRTISARPCFQEMSKALEAALPVTCRPRREATAGALPEEGPTLGGMRRSGAAALYSALGRAAREFQFQLNLRRSVPDITGSYSN